MRKVLLIICSVTLVLGMVGSAEAITFTNTEYIGEWLSGTGNRSWQHDTPHNFEVPGSDVISATLAISGWLVRDDGTDIFINEEIEGRGSLNEGSWLTFGFSWTEFGIEDVFADWDAGDPLEITMKYENLKGFNLLFSKFTLNYSNDSTPVPEPATLLLLGFGLIGMSFLGRRNFPPKSHQA